MPLKIVIDENVPREIISALNQKNFELTVIRENFPGISDREIIELAGKKKP